MCLLWIVVNQHSHLHMVFLISLLLGHNSVLIGGLGSYITCTANIFNVIFTLFTCVPLSTVIPLHMCTALFTFNYCSKYSGKNVTTDLQWFTVTSTLLHCIVMCMANTCNFYTFLRVSQFPLYIFAVWDNLHLLR